MTPEEIALLVKLKDETSSQLDQMKGKFAGLGDTIGKVGTIAGGFLAANAVQSGVQAVTGFIGDSVAAIKESIQVNAQLKAALESTGASAWTTADKVSDLAGSLEKHSLFEDEAILKGQNLLLTFTNVTDAVDGSSEIFSDASRIMVDMAQAMGTDASGSAIMLGKALNDPTQGISALTRVGVTFTDQQKEQIKAMQEAGDMAGAQGVILNELNKEFGGSAQAASDAAGASERYKDKMNDLQEEIGTKMLPINEKLMEAKIALIDLLVTKVIPVLNDLAEKYWPSVSEAIGQVVAFVEENWPKIQPIIEFAANFVKTQIEGMIQTIKGIVEVIQGVIMVIDGIIHGDWAQVWDGMNKILEGALDIAIGTIKRMFGSIPGIIVDLAEQAATAAFNMGKRLADSVIDGIGNIASRVADKLSIAGVSINDVGNFITGRASGGSVQPGQGYFVGEQGIEWFQPDQPGQIISNGNLTRLPGAGGGVNVTITGPVYGEQGARDIGSQIGWETSLELQRRGAA